MTLVTRSMPGHGLKAMWDGWRTRAAAVLASSSERAGSRSGVLQEGYYDVVEHFRDKHLARASPHDRVCLSGAVS